MLCYPHSLQGFASLRPVDFCLDILYILIYTVAKSENPLKIVADCKRSVFLFTYENTKSYESTKITKYYFFVVVEGKIRFVYRFRKFRTFVRFRIFVSILYNYH